MRGAGLPPAAWAMAATASAVPDDATNTSNPYDSISRWKGHTSERTNARHDATDSLVGAPSAKNRSVRRTAPSLKLRAARTAPR